MAVKQDYEPPTHRQIEATDRSWFIAPPYGWRHPVTGRHGWQPDPSLLAFGQYVKRARYLAGISQVQLAKQAGIDQGALSRLERALAPAMKVERLVRLSGVLGKFLPLGYCPHEQVRMAARPDEEDFFGIRTADLDRA